MPTVFSRGQFRPTGGSDTAGCNILKEFATPGCRYCSRAYSRQYEDGVGTETDAPGNRTVIPLRLDIGDLTEEEITGTTGREHDQAIEDAEIRIERRLNEG